MGRHERTDQEQLLHVDIRTALEEVPDDKRVGQRTALLLDCYG